MLTDTSRVSVVEQSYGRLKEHVLGLKQKVTIVLLGDFNARVGRSTVVNPGVHAQRGLWYLVCASLCVCLWFFRATCNEADREQYQWLQCYKRFKNDRAIFLKWPRSCLRNWQCR